MHICIYVHVHVTVHVHVHVTVHVIVLHVHVTVLHDVTAEHITCVYPHFVYCIKYVIFQTHCHCTGLCVYCSNFSFPCGTRSSH